MKRVLVVNGPNLNLLGSREPEVYGSTTLNELEELIAGWGTDLGLSVSCFQSNHEGEIIDRLHDSRHAHDAIIINAGALTHYSYALHDAIAAIDLPTVEVHISNIKERENWRSTSVISPACRYMIRGRGIEGYRDALVYLVNHSKIDPETISYGEDIDQVGDLLVPDSPGPHRVAALIHGGFWRDRWTRDIMESLALDLYARGWATWNLEYHRVGTGGGWPATFEDVAAGIDRLAGLADEYDLNLDEVTVIGHSAGGHLALWAAGRHHPANEILDVKPAVAVKNVVALAPVSDLDMAHADGIGTGAVAGFLRKSPEAAPRRYAAASPRRLLPLGVRQILVHGTEDDAVPVQMSRTYAAAAAAAGDQIVFKEMVGIDHSDLINPRSAAWSAVIAELSA